MVKTVEYKDPARLELIKELEAVSRQKDSGLWSQVAKELSRVRKNRRQVNVYKIDKYTSDGEFVVVPGKVLGEGQLTHPVNVAAFRFTEGALKKIESAGGKTMTLMELAKTNPQGNKIRLMG